MLDLHRVRVFRSVVASGSVQAAADNLQEQAEQWRQANQLLVERYQGLDDWQVALTG